MAGLSKPSPAAFTPLPEAEPSIARSQTTANEEVRENVSDKQGAQVEVSEGVSDRRDAGGEASTSGSTWVSLEHHQGSNMPPWAATRPALLWLWVQPGMHVTSCWLKKEETSLTCIVPLQMTR